MATSRNVEPLCPVVKDTLREMIDEIPLVASIPFESIDEEDHQVPDSIWRSSRGNGSYGESLFSFVNKDWEGGGPLILPAILVQD